MINKYIHFTDYKSAKAIIDSEVLWQNSYGPANAIFAVIEGGAWVPSVQTSSMGRASKRNVAVVFTTPYLPDYAMPEEVVWHLDELPIQVIDLLETEEAKNLLNSSIPEDEDFDLLKIPIHPAFNDFGDWVRMPEDFTPWTPGQDNQKYSTARKIWLETKSVDRVKNFWSQSIQEFKNLIQSILLEITSIL